LLIGSGDRSQRIRTYNFPQGRVTDHRINLTLYKIERIMDGELDDIIDALAHEHQAEQLASLTEEAARPSRKRCARPASTRARRACCSPQRPAFRKRASSLIPNVHCATRK